MEARHLVQLLDIVLIETGYHLEAVRNVLSYGGCLRGYRETNLHLFFVLWDIKMIVILRISSIRHSFADLNSASSWVLHTVAEAEGRRELVIVMQATLTVFRLIIFVLLFILSKLKGRLESPQVLLYINRLGILIIYK